VNNRNEKSMLNAIEKIKVFIKTKLLPPDYLTNLMMMIKMNALSGYEIRFINQLTIKNAATLSDKITDEYLNRLIAAQNKVNEGEETLILTEELQK
jgi:hypothetical protein